MGNHKIDLKKKIYAGMKISLSTAGLFSTKDKFLGILGRKDSCKQYLSINRFRQKKMSQEKLSGWPKYSLLLFFTEASFLMRKAYRCGNKGYRWIFPF